MSLNFPYTINGLNNIDVDDVSCDTFFNQPSSYFTGITSNLQTQLNNVYTKSASDSKYITQTQLTTLILDGIPSNYGYFGDFLTLVLHLRLQNNKSL